MSMTHRWDHFRRDDGGSCETRCARWRVLLLPLALAMLLAVGGCGDALRRQDEKRPTPMIQGRLHTTASLVEADRGRTVTLAPGGTVAVRLEACGGCPFVWVQAEKLGGGVVAFVGEALERSPAVPEGEAGGGGFDVFVYKGLKPGEQVLRFFYSDGKSRIDKEVDYRVVVR